MQGDGGFVILSAYDSSCCQYRSNSKTLLFSKQRASRSRSPGTTSQLMFELCIEAS